MLSNVYKYVCCVHSADACVVFTLYVYVEINGLEKSNQQKSNINRKPHCFCIAVFCFHSIRAHSLSLLLLTTCYLLFASCFLYLLVFMFNVHWLCFSIRKSLFVVDALSLFACSVLKQALTKMDPFAQPSPQPQPPPRPPTPLTDTRPPIYGDDVNVKASFAYRSY